MRGAIKEIIVIILLSSIFTPLNTVYSSEYSHYDEDINIVTLYPTGADDTENLKAAFQKVIDGGPGGTVRLSEGEFMISEEIVVVNFDGAFIGSGIGKTTLKNEYTEEWPHRTEDHFTDVAGLFLFYQTDELVHSYHISDMKIIVQGKTYEYSSFYGMNVFDIVGRVNGDKTDFYETEMNTNIENVYFQGSKIDAWHVGNIVNPYQVGGEFVHTDAIYFKPVSGTHVIRNCVFDLASGPKPNCMNGYCVIENNIMRNSGLGGILYDPSGIADESQYVVRNNTFHDMQMFGLWLYGMDNIRFEDNRIYDCATGLMLNLCQDNVFVNNQISNCTQYGFVLDSSSGNVFQNNTLSDNGNDFFWESAGGEILFKEPSQINSILISNSTTEEVSGLKRDIDQITEEKESLEAMLETEQEYCEGLEYQLNQSTDDIKELENELRDASSEINSLNAQLSSTYSITYVTMFAVVVAAISGVIGYLVSKRLQ